MLNVQEASIYTYTPGRQMPGANGYTRNLSFDFKVYTQCSMFNSTNNILYIEGVRQIYEEV